jgi:hypothetical protein
MPELDIEVSAVDVRAAVQQALDDLEAIKDDEVGPDGSHTTDARAEKKDYWGTRGATRKRLAEVEYLLHDDHWRVTLQKARDDYYRGLQLAGYRDHWLLGQYVVLRTVLDATDRPAGRARPAAKRPPQRRGSGDRWWEETCGAVRLGLRSTDPQERMWAWSSLADLRLVALRERWEIPGVPRAGGPVPDLQEMVNSFGGPDECPAIWPTFRQFWRWRDWWIHRSWAKEAEQGYEYLLGLVSRSLRLEAPAPVDDVPKS